MIPVAHAQEVPMEISLPVEEKEDCPETEIRCNCYLFVKSKIPNLPFSKELVPNIPKTKPIGGAVAIFDYDGKPHYAVTTGIAQTATTTLIQVDECNYKKGICGSRWIDINSYAPLIGFRMVL